MGTQKGILAETQSAKLSLEQVKLFKVAYLSGAQEALEVIGAAQQLRNQQTVESLFQALTSTVDRFESEGWDLQPSHD